MPLRKAVKGLSYDGWVDTLVGGAENKPTLLERLFGCGRVRPRPKAFYWKSFSARLSP